MRTFLIALGTSAAVSAVTAGIIFAVVDENPEPVPAAPVEEAARAVSAQATEGGDAEEAGQARADGESGGR